MNSPIEFARILSMWSVSCLIAAVLSIALPWRQWFNIERSMREIRDIRNRFASTGLEPTWSPIGFLGGWFSAGKTEAGLLLATIVIGIHAIALVAAENRSQAGFILIVIAFIWTFFATWQLQRSLKAENEMISSREKAGLDAGTELVYSDDEKTSELLVDDVSGLRGRPDQIVIIEGEFILLSKRPVRCPRNLINLIVYKCLHTFHSLSQTPRNRLPMAFYATEIRTFTKSFGTSIPNDISRRTSLKFND